MALVAVLCVAAATPLAAQAQQDSLAAPQAGASATQASSASISSSPSLPGPRLRPEWRRVEPVFPRGSTAGPMAASGGTTTITVTTLVLVLLIIIVVLLV
jgi:hypothetical protein